MVLVDTSVWVHHLREGMPELQKLLAAGEVICHPFVVGELACGNLKNRAHILSLLQLLPQAIQATPREVLDFIDRHCLMGKGLGYIDIHLCASAMLTGTRLWTEDKRLNEANAALGISHVPPSR